MYMGMYVRTTSELEVSMVGAERIKQYSEIETEAPYEIEATEPEVGWPPEGVVTFENYSTRYRPELELVLNDVTFQVKSSEKVCLFVMFLPNILHF